MMTMGTEMPVKTIWRFFPWFVATGMLAVVAVNGGMVYAALHTFPGNAGSDGFDLSNHYNSVLDRVARQDALGWAVRAEVAPGDHPVIVLTDRSGAALSGAGLRAPVSRPVGAPHTKEERFTEVSPGRYVGAEVLDEKGQWDLLLSATAAGQSVSATRRIVVR
jgi:nitrogen fixation protein FixH